MAKSYSYRTYTDYQSDTNLSHGVIPDDTSWHTTTELSGSKTAQYFYRDANAPDGVAISDANSIRVILAITDSWTASIDRANNLTITVTTNIASIVRDDLRGAVLATPAREISIARSVGSPVLWSYQDYTVGTPRTIATNINIGTETFTLAPGEGATRSSLYLHNQVIGGASYDNIFIGVEFRNSLPVDYRPGMILDANGVWQSHNRDTGAANILTPTGWRTMRTANGGVESDNPPLIRHSDGYKNMRNIGANG